MQIKSCGDYIEFTWYLMIQIIAMKLNSVHQLELLLHNLKFMIKCGLQEMRLKKFKIPETLRNQFTK